MTTSEATGTANGWRRFWNRGGWWRAFALALAYMVVYQLFSLLDGARFGGLVDPDDLFADPQSVFFGLGLPVLLGGLVALLFVWTVGWTREIFGRQPVTGSWWMWIVVALVVIPIVLRAVATDYAAYAPGVVPTMLLVGLFIGFAEELLTRGLAVNLLRRGGYGEKVVMVLSSLIFALLHSVNILTGQEPIAVLLTVVYTFGFGTMMYLVMRVTGSIVWAMLLHGATDPTTFLATGGVDAHGATTGDAALLGIAGVFNVVYLVVAIVAIFLVKGKVRADQVQSTA
ncbi:CPBP family intramembrane glutamic endopeptidase [Agromyces allii]|uniref:CAAX prenyl protease 2/Lysostaphin resistance protein A-like domain-containing protein n=1 Tax=Agromyces allii TaxID=393607 RepID=A0ABP5BJX6_9MICO|nr:CPBP family intramembrane glutamic endopeptidase [Agromyces allii]